MSKYSSYSRPKPKPRNLGVHPVMRGIGCIMIVLVPILAYGAAVLLVNYGGTQGWPIPPNWFGPPSLPPILERVQGLRPIVQFLRAQYARAEVSLANTIAAAVFERVRDFGVKRALGATDLVDVASRLDAPPDERGRQLAELGGIVPLARRVRRQVVLDVHRLRHRRLVHRHLELGPNGARPRVGAEVLHEVGQQVVAVLAGEPEHRGPRRGLCLRPIGVPSTGRVPRPGT